VWLERYFVARGCNGEEERNDTRQREKMNEHYYRGPNLPWHLLLRRADVGIIYIRRRHCKNESPQFTHVVIELFLEVNLGIDSGAAEGGSGKE